MAKLSPAFRAALSEPNSDHMIQRVTTHSNPQLPEMICSPLPVSEASLALHPKGKMRLSSPWECSPHGPSAMSLPLATFLHSGKISRIEPKCLLPIHVCHVLWCFLPIQGPGGSPWLKNKNQTWLPFSISPRWRCMKNRTRGRENVCQIPSHGQSWCSSWHYLAPEHCQEQPLSSEVEPKPHPANRDAGKAKQSDAHCQSSPRTLLGRS